MHGTLLDTRTVMQLLNGQIWHIYHDACSSSAGIGFVAESPYEQVGLSL